MTKPLTEAEAHEIYVSDFHTLEEALGRQRYGADFRSNLTHRINAETAAVLTMAEFQVSRGLTD